MQSLPSPLALWPVQKLPTQGWDESQLEGVLSQAFLFRAQYTSSHLKA